MTSPVGIGRLRNIDRFRERTSKMSVKSTSTSRTANPPMAAYTIIIITSYLWHCRRK